MLIKTVLGLYLILVCKIAGTIQFRRLTSDEDSFPGKTGHHYKDDHHEFDDYIGHGQQSEDYDGLSWIMKNQKKNIFPFTFDKPLPTYAETLRRYRLRSRLNRLVGFRMAKLRKYKALQNILRLQDMLQKELDLKDQNYKKAYYNKNAYNFDKYQKEDSDDAEELDEDDLRLLNALNLDTNDTRKDSSPLNKDTDFYLSKGDVKDNIKSEQEGQNDESIGEMEENEKLPEASVLPNRPLFAFKTTRFGFKTHNGRKFHRIVNSFRVSKNRMNQFPENSLDEEPNVPTVAPKTPTKLESFLEQFKM